MKLGLCQCCNTLENQVPVVANVTSELTNKKTPHNIPSVICINGSKNATFDTVCWKGNLYLDKETQNDFFFFFKSLYFTTFVPVTVLRWTGWNPFAKCSCWLVKCELCLHWHPSSLLCISFNYFIEILLLITSHHNYTPKTEHIYSIYSDCIYSYGYWCSYLFAVYCSYLEHLRPPYMTTRGHQNSINTAGVSAQLCRICLRPQKTCCSDVM